MYRGLTASLLLHLSVLAWAVLSFQMTPHLDLPDVTPISVSIIQPSDVTRIKEGDPDAKELEAKAKDDPNPDQFKKEAPKPKPVTAPPPPAPEPPPPPPQEAKVEPPKPEPPKPEPPKEESKADPIADKIAALPPPKPEPAPGPTPEEKKALEEKIEQERIAAEQKKAEEQRKLEEKKKAEDKKRKEEELKKKEKEKKLADARRKAEEAKKKQFDADRIAALIDKSPDKKGGPASAAQPSKPTTHTGPTAGEHGGKDSVLSAREQDMLAGMLKAQIAPCWRLPGAGGGTDNPVVTLRWRLRQDGALEGEPQIMRPAAGAMAGLATEAAIRAVKSCAPFKLPAEHYAAWKEVIWEFDPSKML